MYYRQKFLEHQVTTKNLYNSIILDKPIYGELSPHTAYSHLFSNAMYTVLPGGVLRSLCNVLTNASVTLLS
jgi:hypothetical protein